MEAAMFFVVCLFFFLALWPEVNNDVTAAEITGHYSTFETIQFNHWG